MNDPNRLDIENVIASSVMMRKIFRDKMTGKVEGDGMRISKNEMARVMRTLGLCMCVIGTVFASEALAQTATVTLEILNPPDSSGDFVLSKGTQVEVEFTIVDPSNELDKNDTIRLVRVDDADKVSDKKRGNNLTGTISLNTNGNKALGQLRVEYEHDGQVLATVPANPTIVLVVADEGAIVLAEQIDAMQVQLDIIDTVQGAQIGVNTTNIATNATNIASNDADIAANAAGIAGNTTGIASSAASISTNTTNIATNTGAISALDARVTINEGDIDNLETEVAALQSGSSLDGLTDPDNTALGVNALTANTTGVANMASGNGALQSNTTGSNNTAIGNLAGQNQTTGSDNIYVVNEGVAGESGTIKIGTPGNQTTAVIQGIHNVTPAGPTETVVIDADGQLGSVAGDVGTNAAAIATNTTAIGTNSLAITGNTTAISTNAAAIVSNDTDIAGLQTDVNTNTTNIATNITAIASLEANAVNIFPNNNTAAGTNVLPNIPTNTGSHNTAYGTNALSSNTTGSGNIAIGVDTMFSNTTGHSNTAMGMIALQNNTTGILNTAVGGGALYGNTTGGSNTATGVGALKFNTTGASNTATGVNSLLFNTTGNRNTAVGERALRSNTTGGSNTAVGLAALEDNTTGINNTAMGLNALKGNTTGSSNVAMGYLSLNGNTTGTENTALGMGAMPNNTTGNLNTATGNYALNGNTTGGSNTGVGRDALRSNTTGNHNNAFGRSAGYNLTGGDNNLYLDSPGPAALGAESDTIRIGDTQTSAYIKGIHNVTPTGGSIETVVIDSTGQLGSVAGDVGSNTINIATNATAIGNNSLAIATNATDIDALEALNLGTLAGVVNDHTTDIGNLQASAITGTTPGTFGVIPRWTGSQTLGNSLLFDDGTRIGIGTTTPGQVLDVNGTGRFTPNMAIANTDVSACGGMSLGTTLNANLGACGNLQWLNIRATGNSNFSNPPAGAVPGVWQIMAQYNGDFDSALPLAFGTTNTERMRINEYGLVGIGTTAPDAQLKVNSDTDITRLWVKGSTPNVFSSNQAMIRIEENDPNPSPTGSFAIRSFYNNAEVFHVRHDGNAHFAGALFAAGGVSSSRTLKENILDLSLKEAKETLKELVPIKFTYKDDSNKDLQIGFIAEDVPELVSTPGRKGIQPMDIIAILTKVTQDQQKQIEELKAQLTQQNDVFKARLDRLEAQSSAVPVSLH